MKCTQCSREAEDPQHKLCEHCRKIRREYSRLRRDAWDDSQCSTCGKPLNGQTKRKTCDKCLEVKREYHKENCEQRRKRQSVWSKANPEKRRKRRATDKHTYRARKQGNGGTFTFEELNELFEQQEGFCAYCGELLYSSFDKDVHVEHKLPVSRGGTSYISNIVLSCSKCNWEKGTKTHEEFLQARNA